MVIPRDKRKHTQKVDRSIIVQGSLRDSFIELNPFKMLKNPIMLIVEICFILMLSLVIKPDLFGPTYLSRDINFVIAILLFLTIFFSNFAENIAKHITKAQVESLRIIHGDLEVKRIKPNGLVDYVFSSQLEKGDIIKVQEGDLIPLDGEVIEGVASVDESAITGESSPVLKEAGTDISSSVTGGTRVLTDWLFIKITSEQGQTYLDQMVEIADATERHKTPNEITLHVLLIATTISFLLVVICLAGVMTYINLKIELPILITLLICLVPTTIGGLITPIRISGFDKMNKLNIITTSEKSIEASGDIDILFLDKTGTVTFGNRMAIEFIPLGANSLNEICNVAFLASYFDQTPEGKSIVSLANSYGINIDIKQVKGIPHEFSAHSRMSGIDLENGDILRKGASDAIKKFVLNNNGKIWPNTDQIVENIALQGGTPLLISKNNEIIGVIYLKDLIKTGMKDKFKKLNDLGIITIMCTGDNELTAKVISKEIGVDEYIAHAKPEDKIHLIKNYQATGLIVGMVGDGTNDAPALAQADIGLAMNSGTVAAKEASNMIDLDSDPSKTGEIITIGRQLLTTRGALTTFSVTNDISKYFAILPAALNIKGLEVLNVMHLESNISAIISALIFNTIIIPLMTPFALKGVWSKTQSPDSMLIGNLIKFGLGGLIIPFIGIKLIDLLIGRFI